MAVTTKEELEKGRMVKVSPTGISMKPLLREGKTHVLIKSIFSEDGIRHSEWLKQGDMPIFLRPDGKYVIHRLMEVGTEYCVTRGDNCLYGEKIPADWILGIVVEIYRGGIYIRTDHPAYVRYVKFWNKSYPIRTMYYRVRLLGRKARNNVKRIKDAVRYEKSQ